MQRDEEPYLNRSLWIPPSRDDLRKSYRRYRESDLYKKFQKENKHVKGLLRQKESDLYKKFQKENKHDEGLLRQKESDLWNRETQNENEYDEGLLGSSHLPNMQGKDIFEVNFSHYLGVHPKDIVLTNGSAKFKVHKEILQACSNVLDDILEGDIDAEEVIMPDVSDDALELYYKLMYDTPHERRERRLPLSAGFGDRLTSCMRIITKYDCKLMRPYFTQEIPNWYCTNQEALERYCDLAYSLRLDDFATAFEDEVIAHRTEDDIDLCNFGKDIIVRMMKAHDFDSDFTFFDKLMAYAKKTRDPEILKALQQVEGKSNSWYERYLLEKKKSDAFAKEFAKSLTKGPFTPFGNLFGF